MKKKLGIGMFLLLTVFFVRTGMVHAQMGSMMGASGEEVIESVSEHSDSVETVLADILKEHGVSTVAKLDIKKVSEDQWERLGDAVMEIHHPGAAHETMDRMMGGEGSDSLRQMHINMGKSYLGYGKGSGVGSMTPFHQGYTRHMGFDSMMGYGSTSTIHIVVCAITWLALLAFLVSGTYFFVKKAGKK